MYLVYILYSERFDKFYIGQTNDMDDRFKRHNAGQVQFTAPFIPWRLMCTIKKESRPEAVGLEFKLKNLSKARLSAFIEKYGNH